MQEYSDVFDGTLGKIPETRKIVVDETVQPDVHPPQRLPVALRPRIKCQLDELAQRRVISWSEEVYSLRCERRISSNTA